MSPRTADATAEKMAARRTPPPPVAEPRDLPPATTRPIRLTMDLPPAVRDGALRWAARAAGELGRVKVPLAAVVRALLLELAEDPELGQRIMRRLPAELERLNRKDT